MSEPLPRPATSYELFPLLRRLEALHPDSPRLGERGPAQRESIRLRPSTSLGFAATEVVHVEQVGTYSPRSIVTTNLPGIYGAGSPLPRSYAHQILLDQDEQPQQRDFLDLLLHHRVYSLWYRGWKRLHYEQGFEPRGSDALSRALLDLLGLQPETAPDELGIEPVRMLRYLGLLIGRTRSADGLGVLLRDELGLPVEIEQLPPRSRTLPQDQWCRLSSDPMRGGSLGRDILIGAKRIDRLGALRLHIGPVSYPLLRGLWFGGPLHRRLVALCRFYLRQPLDLILSIRVPAAEIPRTRLGAHPDGRLGSPACTGAPQQDPVVFVLTASLSHNPQQPERACFSSSTAPSSSA